MENWINIILAVLPPFALLFIGSLARGMDWLGREADRTLSRFIICVLYPCFIVYHVLGTDSPIEVEEAWIAAIFGFLAISIGFTIAGYWSLKCAKLVMPKNRLFVFAQAFLIMDFLPYPWPHYFLGMNW